MTNPATPENTAVLTCISCGYDLRASVGRQAECPECGFAIADSSRGALRLTDRWAWKVRIGLLLMMWCVPALAVYDLLLVRWASVGLPLTLLNLAAPKVWGGPMVWLWGSSTLDLVPVMSLITLNTFGVWLIATPDDAQTPREAMLSLRRWLRCYPVMAVAFLWMILYPPYPSAIRLPQDDAFHPIATIILIELPGTFMLYLYLARLADRLRDPSIARRARNVMRAGLALQAIAIVALTGVIPMSQLAASVGLIFYGIPSLALGLYAADLWLDLIRLFGASVTSAAGPAPSNR